MEAYIDSNSASLRSFSSGVVNAVRRMSSTSLVIHESLCAWSQRIHQRRQPLSLSDQMLSDIGVSRAEVFKECEKPFWRA
jgi:uncharacterized protein YjiS (DUF1127 family)